jgi:hypothetical protein
LALGCAVVLPACSSEEPLPAACPPRKAAFRLEITAEDGALPEDTSLDVRYQGSHEAFELRSAARQNEDVCCRPVAAPLSSMPGVECPGGRAPDAGQVRALYCELWTNGIAEITVTGGDYPDITRTLEAVAREDDCGLETQSVRVVLARPDGGS